MRTDFENIKDGSRLVLYPNGNNPIHRNPTHAVYNGGYFYCDGSPPEEGPDYYFRDVNRYVVGYELVE